MTGLVILAFFAAVWGAAGLSQLGFAAVWFALPVAISVLLLLAARFGSGPLQAYPDPQKVNRLVGAWSGIEGVAILIGTNLVANLGHPEWVMATVSLIVGLHFLPLAHGFPQPLYYGTGLGLIALALAGFAAPGRVSPGVVGVIAALLIWATIAALLSRSARAQRGKIGAEHVGQG
ncbi:hypothetical protein [Novosphingobium rosa]|uniref:hypothetical protein n=1 Tax=Novosphingobium rosa TaxID=76978 RepID=UPI0008360102|nr:hypothetical protein [Novosphingobium rosa]